MLLAITLLAKPVYPGMGLSNFTYYFPSLKTVFEFPNWFAFYSAIFCLKDSDCDKVNWLISFPVTLKLVGCNKMSNYWLHNDFFVRNTDNVCCCSLKHLRWRDVHLLLSGDILVSWVDVLSFNVGLLGDVESDFSEGVSVDILWFDAFDISCIT